MSLSRTILAVVGAMLVLAEPALAETAAAPAAAWSLSELAAALGIGVAVFGGTMSQGKLVSAAVESISRNPGAAGQMNTPIILGLALIESLVLLAFLVASKLAGLF